MTTTVSTLKATAGPSVWDLLFEALGHGFRPTFTFEGWGEKRVQILRVGPDFDQTPKQSGCHTVFWVEGYIWLDGKDSVAGCPNRFYGMYSTETRKGTFEAVVDRRPIWQIEADWNE